MYKYPNGDKVTTKKLEYGNLVTTKLPECDGISKIYLSSGLLVQNIEQSDGVFHVYATSSSEEGTCPYCGHKSKPVLPCEAPSVQALEVVPPYDSFHPYRLQR